MTKRSMVVTMMREIDKGKSGYLVGKRISFVLKHVTFEVPAEPFVEMTFEELKESGQGQCD